MEDFKKVIVKVEFERNKSTMDFKNQICTIDDRLTFLKEEWLPFIEMIDSISLQQAS